MLYHGTSAILDLYDRARGRGHINQYCTSARDITNLSRMKPYYACAVVQHAVSTVQYGTRSDATGS